ncbi:MAG: CusA/CzcA family heavy metal efflux RND transporter [Candidatus Aminicenantes bacterium]|nr:CusA/CzcA family heavy metal efflux RND transporter [Candidatus Aminicenantes bacterium]
MIDKVIEFALKHRLLTVLLVGLVSVWGIIVYIRMPKDIYPDLNAPLVKIITENPGMASEDVERLISFPLESLLAGAPGVTRVRSESTTGDSVVTVEFDWGTDIYRARQIVSSKLELIAGRLPLGTTQPILGPVSSRMGEVFEFAVTGENVDPMELRSLADWTIRYRLQGVPGVSFIINLGGFVKQFQVFLKPEMLKNYDIAISEVKEAIQNSNRNFSGGIISKGAQEVLIKGLGRIETLNDIKNTVITSRNNVPVYVKDVAEVKVGPKFRREAGSHNARESVYITVEKQYGGDTLIAIRNIKEALGRIARDLPEGAAVKPFYDQSILILKSIHHVEISILQGALLITLVMIFFMWNLRSSLIASLTIPFSILIALVLMDIFGVGLTVMSIGGLAIGIGKMANGSIIMVENIFRVLKESQNSVSSQEIVAKAAKEVGKYLFSASLIIILVFVPLFTLQGLEGAMFRPTAFAVAAALFGAMLLNITLQPILAVTFLAGKRIKDRKNPVTEFLVKKYHALLATSLDHKKAIISGFILLVVGAFIAHTFLGKEFVPPLDEGSIMVSTVMLPETSLEESVLMGMRVEKIFLSFPEVLSVSRTTGTAEASEHLHPVNHSHYLVELLPLEKRKRGFKEITAAMRLELDKLPGIAYIFEQPISNKLAEMLTGTEGQLSVKLFGPDLEILNEKIEDVRNVMAEVRGVADLQIEQTAGVPQLIIRLNRERLALFGISVSLVADTIETALNGIEATDVYEADRVTAVLIRLPEEYRNSEDAIRNLLISAPNGERIPLSELTEIRRGEGPQTIFRENMMRRKIILCNIVKRDIGGFVKEAQEKIDEQVDLPPGYFVTFGGQFESQQRALRHLSLLMVIVILIIFIVLFSSFGRIWQALLIILNIPSTLIGGILGLLIAGQTLNVSSTIGLIALFGICVQNDVILVARINDLRRQGMTIRDAVVQGAVTKFRPIFMTDMVMIVAVLPLALIVTTGAELHRPLAVVYIGGFFFAILLRLIVVPVLYEALARLRE